MLADASTLLPVAALVPPGFEPPAEHEIRPKAAVTTAQRKLGSAIRVQGVRMGIRLAAAAMPVPIAEIPPLGIAEA
jgi:hypothetical protein